MTPSNLSPAARLPHFSEALEKRGKLEKPQVVKFFTIPVAKAAMNLYNKIDHTEADTPTGVPVFCPVVKKLLKTGGIL